jgi:hypothetical protein
MRAWLKVLADRHPYVTWIPVSTNGPRQPTSKQKRTEQGWTGSPNLPDRSATGGHESSLDSRPFLVVLGCERLRFAAAPRDLMANGFTRTVVAQISLLGAATRIVERHTLHSTLTVLDLCATAITYHHCLSRHDTLLRARVSARKRSNAFRSREPRGYGCHLWCAFSFRVRFRLRVRSARSDTDQDL